MSSLLRVLTLTGFAVAAAAACSDPNALPTATLSNDTSTVTIYSLRTGPLTLPNAYSVNADAGVQTWQAGTNFEFAYSTDTTGRSMFLLLDVLGLSATASVKPGLILSTIPFDQMLGAPQNGYITSDTVFIAPGQSYYVRTGVNTCAALGVPLYGKVQVLSIDSTAGSVQLLVLADQNCGYRGLGLGVPKS